LKQYKFWIPGAAWHSNTKNSSDWHGGGGGGVGSFVKVGEQINYICHNKAHSREIRGLSLAGHHVDDEEGEKNHEQIHGVEDRDLLEEFSFPIIEAVVAEN
jgi:hypothetical protein